MFRALLIWRIMNVYRKFFLASLLRFSWSNYIAALDSYIKAVDESIHAFSFIHDMLRRLSETDSEAFQAAVFSRIGDLVKLDR